MGTIARPRTATGTREPLAAPRALGHNRSMTNRLALILFILIALAFVADFTLNDGEASLFLAKELFEFLDWLAFWR